MSQNKFVLNSLNIQCTENLAYLYLFGIEISTLFLFTLLHMSYVLFLWVLITIYFGTISVPRFPLCLWWLYLFLFNRTRCIYYESPTVAKSHGALPSFLFIYLFVFFFSYLFYIPAAVSPPPSPISPSPLLCFALPSAFLFHFYLERAGIPWISTKHGI